MPLQGMERSDLPIVVVLLCFGGQRRYLGRLPTKTEFDIYRDNAGFPPGDLVYEDWSSEGRRKGVGMEVVNADQI